MRHLIFGVIFSLTSLTSVKGQFESIELRLGANYTFIGDQKNQGSSGLSPNTGFSFITSDVASEETFKNFFGYTIGANASFDLGKRLKIKTGLHFDYIKFQRDTKLLSSDPTINSFSGALQGLLVTNGASFEEIDNFEELIINQNQSGEALGDPEKGPAHIVYLAIPVTLNYLINNKFYGIFSISVATRIFSRTKGDIFRFDQTTLNFTVEEQTFTKGEGFNDLQFFLSAGIGYRLNPSLALELSYQRGLSPIFEEVAQIAGEAKFNQINLGINYQLFKGTSKN